MPRSGSTDPARFVRHSPCRTRILNKARAASCAARAGRWLLAGCLLAVAGAQAQAEAPSPGPAARSGTAPAALEPASSPAASDPWQTTDGWPSPLARELLVQMTAAADEGLDARDYDLGPLVQLAARSAPAAQGLWQALMQPRVLQWMRDLRHGTRPRGEGYSGASRHEALLQPADGSAERAALQALAAGADWDSVRQALAPAQPGHDALRQALRQARRAADDATLTPAQRREAGRQAGRLSLALAVQRQMPKPAIAMDRWVQVNLADFRLQMMVRGVSGRPELAGEIDVIVGRAKENPTPTLLAGLRSIDFSPYWNVPMSIARAETVPQLKARPSLVRSLGYEIVTADGRVLRQFGSAELNAVLDGQARIRQRPGPRNALGRIKFTLPNPQNIYLHHTPSVGLFERPRRDFSHGCVRVAEPLRLARFLIGDDPAWTDAHMAAAMQRDTPLSLSLPQVLPVILAYNTVVVRDGQLRYLPDIYQRDAALARRLSSRPRPVYPPMPATHR